MQLVGFVAVVDVFTCLLHRVLELETTVVGTGVAILK